MDNCILGVRRAESTKRAKRYKEPIICRNYKKGEHVNQILPILEWSNQDVEEFILDRGIKCHPLYYDEQGRFHVERRLGCIGCPMSSKRNDELRMYPKFVKAFIDNAKVFLQKKTATSRKFKDAYHLFYHNYFCRSYAEYKDRVGDNLFGDKVDIKKFLEDYYNIEL